MIAGYISYAFHRVGEVTATINGIDRIMASGFNWAPPGALVDLMGPAAAVEMIEAAGPARTRGVAPDRARRPAGALLPTIPL